MKIPRRQRNRSPAEVTVTPLVDLFLNILIFFLVTSTFSSDTVFFVDLPETTASEEMGQEEQLSISLSSRGEIALNNKRVSEVELEARLNQVPAERRSTLPIVLRADKETPHGVVVRVIDKTRELGLTNIGIVTEKGSTE